jgi:P-type Ca2+ transporter type 2C
VDRPWSASAEQVLRDLNVSAETGLTADEVDRRRREHGPNRLRETRPRSAGEILLAQLRSVIVLLLAVAAGLSFVFGDAVEAFAILVVIVLNALIGFLTEIRAVRSMEALRGLVEGSATVRRAGRVERILAADLVPGDVVLLEGGDVVPADLRILTASRLQADESALTGESLPVDKSAAPVGEDRPLAERTSILFQGTPLTRGSGQGVAVATGMETELGRISTLVAQAERGATPMEERLEALGRRLVWVTVAVAVLVVVSGLFTGRRLFLLLETAIALAVATVPEGLPIISTIALARGLWRMARRNALIEQLSAVETLGSTSVILTDKTGTLTENRMTATRLAVGSGLLEIGGRLAAEGPLREALRAAALCNNAVLRDGPGGDIAGDIVGDIVGDPTEGALLVAAAKAGLRREDLLRETPEIRQEAFDSDLKRMATIHQDRQGFVAFVKGAPEVVLALCARELTAGGEREMDAAARERWERQNEEMAAAGLRVLAVARRRLGRADEDPFRGLTLLGLFGLQDPPKASAREAVEACRAAGIGVVMITGDQAATARNVAWAVGLIDDPGAEVLDGRALRDPGELTPSEAEHLRAVRVFARATPEEKLNLIALHQATGAVVAMTGDGVNDAPALKKADIGVAMGKRGTEVARQAAAMVLEDDELATIVAAVEQGRAIFANVRKFVVYLISCNISEILIIGLASMADVPLPLLPLQILFLNLVTDVFPALALGVGEGDPSLMKQPPRPPSEPFLARRQWIGIVVWASLITLSVFGAMAAAGYWLRLDSKGAVTVSFLTLAAAQLWHVFNMRERGSGRLRNEVTRNLWVWGALALCAGLLVAAVELPPFARILQLEDLDSHGWALVVGASALPALLGLLPRPWEGPPRAQTV